MDRGINEGSIDGLDERVDSRASKAALVVGG
jgi:hypothetical protein